MASYFEEHNCEPLKEGETPDHLLHLARYVGAFLQLMLVGCRLWYFFIHFTQLDDVLFNITSHLSCLMVNHWLISFTSYFP